MESKFCVDHIFENYIFFWSPLGGPYKMALFVTDCLSFKKKKAHESKEKKYSQSFRTDISRFLGHLKGFFFFWTFRENIC